MLLTELGLLDPLLFESLLFLDLELFQLLLFVLLFGLSDGNLLCLSLEPDLGLLVQLSQFLGLGLYFL